MRERQRERNGNGEARRAGDRVVGPTKLPGSTTDTFLGSNHQDTMTTRSLASSPTRRPSAVGLIIAFFLVAAARKSSLDLPLNLDRLISGKTESVALPIE